MIVYLCSYPRSGSALARNLIEHHFRRGTSSVYAEASRPGVVAALAAEDLVTEVRRSPAAGGPYRMLREGCGPYLDERVRGRLACDRERFLLKTHELPFREYFAGELVVHLVRHPGAALWSHWNFIRQIEGVDTVRLEDVIEGEWPADWSEHVGSWLAAGASLRDGYRRVHFEQLVADPEPFLQHVQAVTNLPRVDSGEAFPSFAYWHGRDPAFYRAGRVDEWEDQLSSSRRALLWALHGRVMAQLGYTMPPGAESPAGWGGLTPPSLWPATARRLFRRMARRWRGRRGRGARRRSGP
jgi:hypothetical protein